MGEEAADALIPSGVDCTPYPVIADPPTFAGAVNGTEAEASPAVAVPMVGASGFFKGS
jgi:hypothetical protein